LKTTVEDDFGVAIFRDGSVGAPEGLCLQSSVDREVLKSLALDGSIFFIDCEDPIRMVVEIDVDEPSNDAYFRVFHPVGGRFLLRLPSGELQVSGCATWAERGVTGSLSVAPGAYSVAVFSREPLDVEKYHSEIRRLVGGDDLKFSERVTWVGAAGFVLLAIAVLVALIGSVWLAAYPAVGAVALYALYFAIRRFSVRYRRVDEVREAYDATLPVYILQLEKLEHAEGHSGGFVSAS